MKLLLTSSGIVNDELADNLAQLVGKRFNELKIGFIPSAAFGEPSEDKGWMIDDLSQLRTRGAMVAVISLADLTSEEIAEQLAPVDVVFVGGGQTFYLSWLLQQKGMFELLPKLLETKVYAGISAGTMIATPSLRSDSFAIRQPDMSNEELEKLGPVGRSSAKASGFVPFMIRPHMNGKAKYVDITPEVVQRAADASGLPVYAFDDSCAVRVDGDDVSVVGGGEWYKLEPDPTL